MKRPSQKIVALAIIAPSSMAFVFTSTDHTWEEPYLYRSYIGSEHRSSDIEGEELPKHHWRNPGRWQYSEEPEPEDLPA